MTGSGRSHTEAAAINSCTHQRTAERQGYSKEREDDGKCKERVQEKKMLCFT